MDSMLGTAFAAVTEVSIHLNPVITQENMASASEWLIKIDVSHNIFVEDEWDARSENILLFQSVYFAMWFDHMKIRLHRKFVIPLNSLDNQRLCKDRSNMLANLNNQKNIIDPTYDKQRVCIECLCKCMQ